MKDLKELTPHKADKQNRVEFPERIDESDVSGALDEILVKTAMSASNQTDLTAASEQPKPERDRVRNLSDWLGLRLDLSTPIENQIPTLKGSTKPKNPSDIDKIPEEIQQIIPREYERDLGENTMNLDLRQVRSHPQFPGSKSAASSPQSSPQSRITPTSTPMPISRPKTPNSDQFRTRSGSGINVRRDTIEINIRDLVANSLKPSTEDSESAKDTVQRINKELQDSIESAHPDRILLKMVECLMRTYDIDLGGAISVNYQPDGSKLYRFIEVLTLQNEEKPDQRKKTKVTETSKLLPSLKSFETSSFMWHPYFSHIEDFSDLAITPTDDVGIDFYMCLTTHDQSKLAILFFDKTDAALDLSGDKQVLESLRIKWSDMIRNAMRTLAQNQLAFERAAWDLSIKLFKGLIDKNSPANKGSGLSERQKHEKKQKLHDLFNLQKGSHEECIFLMELYQQGQEKLPNSRSLVRNLARKSYQLETGNFEDLDKETIAEIEQRLAEMLDKKLDAYSMIINNYLELYEELQSNQLELKKAGKGMGEKKKDVLGKVIKAVKKILIQDVTLITHAVLAERERQKNDGKDVLTELHMRERFFEYIQDEIDRGTVENRPFSVLRVQIDNIDEIGEIYGEGIKKITMKKIAGIIQDAIKKRERACVYDEEGFGIFLPNSNEWDASLTAHRIKENISSDQRFQEVLGRNIKVSIGGARFQDIETAPNLIKKAEENMQLASKKKASHKIGMNGMLVSQSEALLKQRKFKD